jgi:DNA-binding transcriptional LysR family regulator
MKNSRLSRPDVLDTVVMQAFVEVTETGSFTGAAGNLGRSPSAITVQIRKLEGQLGATLFNRTSRVVSLTADGLKLLPYARAMIALSNEVSAKLVTPEDHGTVTLGVPFDIGENQLPGILRQFASIYPRIAVNAMLDESAALIRRYRRGELDVALFNCNPDFDGQVGEVVGKDRLIWAGAFKGKAHLRDPLPLAVFEQGCFWRSTALDKLIESGRSFRIAYSSQRATVQRTAVLNDLAISPLPFSYLADGMLELGAEAGFTELAAYQIRMLVDDHRKEGVGPIAEFLRVQLGARRR